MKAKSHRTDPIKDPISDAVSGKGNGIPYQIIVQYKNRRASFCAHFSSQILVVGPCAQSPNSHENVETLAFMTCGGR